MKFQVFFSLAFLLVLISSCKKEEYKPSDSFIHIIHDTDGNKRYYPISLATTQDGSGYLILSAISGWKIQLNKVDETGNMLWKYELPEPYVNAVPNLLEVNGKHYVVCMDAVGLFTYVLEIDEANGAVTEVSSFFSIIYPTYAANTPSGIYIQNYDRTTMRTGIHRISGDLQSVQQSGFIPIFTDIEERIVNHVTYIGKRIPFFISTSPDGSQLAMNGFYNYSFSLIFLNQNLGFSGVYNGAGFNGGFAAMIQPGGGGFSLARFSTDYLYFQPNAALSTTAIDIAENVPAQGKSDLDANKPVVIKELTIKESNYKLFLASTRSNQLLLTIYDAVGTEVAKHTIGKNVPVQASDFIATADGGLQILLQVKVMGAYDRIGLVKLSSKQLEEFIE